MTKIADPDPNPDPDPLVTGTDPQQNVMDPEYCQHHSDKILP
jgi:hypothetical protein